MSKAFAWLDAHLTEALDAPDEHFDGIMMAKEEDWTRLLVAYPLRKVAQDPDESLDDARAFLADRR